MVFILAATTLKVDGIDEEGRFNLMRLSTSSTSSVMLIGPSSKVRNTLPGPVSAAATGNASAIAMTARKCLRRTT